MYAPVTPANGASSDSPVPAPLLTPPIANNGNGAPSHYYTENGELVELDRPRELQIIHVDTEDLQTGTNHAHDGRVRHRSAHALSQGAPAAMTSTIKPIMFHQEYSNNNNNHHAMAPPTGQDPQTQAQRERAGSVGGRERRNSRAGNASFDEYANGSGNGAAGPESQQIRSPASASSSSHRAGERDRPASRSPLLHRDQQAYSPTHNGSPTTSQGNGVPATFASIMNAYAPGAAAGPPERGEREYEYRQEQSRNAGERAQEYAYANGR